MFPEESLPQIIHDHVIKESQYEEHKYYPFDITSLIRKDIHCLCRL